MPFGRCQLKKYIKCKYQMQTEHVSCDKQFHSEDLYFWLAENTDDISTVKNPRKRYIITFIIIIIIIIIIINHFCVAQFPGGGEIAFNSSALSI